MNTEPRLEDILHGLLSSKTIEEIGFTVESVARKPLNIGQEMVATADDTECAVTAFSIQVPNTIDEAESLLQIYHQMPRFRLSDAIVSMKFVADDQSFSPQQRALATLWFSGHLIEHQCQDGEPIEEQIRRHREAVKAHKVIIHFCILSSGAWTLVVAEMEGRLHVEMPS